MKTRAMQPKRARAHTRDAIAVAVATILAGGAVQALAADAQGGELEEIIVSGIRHSIETSIAVKRDQVQVVEVVSAEDIGKLPDTSIADSIARLPGLAAQRIDGRPTAISIRGLGPDYSGALLNGRQVVSSSDGRAAEYDQFPSELVNQVVVYKTNDASVIGQGLSGTIDIRPVSPLSVNKTQAVFGLRGERNSNGKLTSGDISATGNRFSASYIDQFADHTIGLALGYAHLDSPGQSKHYEAWGYGDYKGQWGGGGNGIPAVGTNGDRAVFTQGFTADNTASKQVRDGLMAVVEYKPNEAFSSTVDLYYSKFQQDRVEHFWVGDIGLWSGGANFSGANTTEVNGNTIINSGTVSGGHSLIYDKNFDRTDKIKSIGWKNELKFADGWTGLADIGYSHADRNEYYVQSVARAYPGADLSFANISNPGAVVWSTTQDLTSPSVVQLTNDPDWAELRDPHFTDEIKSLKFSAKGKVGWGFVTGVEAGVAYNQRDKTVNSDAWRLNLASTNVAIPASALRDPVTINVGGINQRILTWDVPSIMGLYTLQAKDPWSAKDNKYAVHEKVTTGFVKFDVDSSVGSVPVRGNFGVQIVHTKQNSDGYAWNDGGAAGSGQVVPVNGGATYTDFLPSLNLAFNLKPDLMVKLGISKTMARPRMDDMRAGADQPHLVPTSEGATTGTWTSNNGGKPDLLPWRATGLDLSLEKYIGKRSYLAVAGFYKKMNSFIYQRTTVRDYTGFPNYSATLVPGCGAGAPNCNPNLGTITTQDNGSGGKVWGLELSASLEGSLLSPTLEGFGVIVSDGITRNSLPKDNNNNPIYLDGFSGMVNSVALYYEKKGFSARVSQRYRSPFTATTRSVLLGNEISTHIDAESQMDAQVGYSFETGALKGLSILLQGNNITNQPAIQRRGPEVVGGAGTSKGLLPWKYDDYGRTVLLGVTYKL